MTRAGKVKGRPATYLEGDRLTDVFDSAAGPRRYLGTVTAVGLLTFDVTWDGGTRRATYTKGAEPPTLRPAPAGTAPAATTTSQTHGRRPAAGRTAPPARGPAPTPGGGPMNLHDVSKCPVGHRCEFCGAAHPEVKVVTRDLAAGVVCLTLCPSCAGFTGKPPILPSTERRFVEQHRTHVYGGPRG